MDKLRKYFTFNISNVGNLTQLFHFKPYLNVMYTHNFQKHFKRYAFTMQCCDLLYILQIYQKLITQKI